MIKSGVLLITVESLSSRVAPGPPNASRFLITVDFKGPAARFAAGILPSACFAAPFVPEISFICTPLRVSGMSMVTDPSIPAAESTGVKSLSGVSMLAACWNRKKFTRRVNFNSNELCFPGLQGFENLHATRPEGTRGRRVSVACAVAF